MPAVSGSKPTREGRGRPEVTVAEDPPTPHATHAPVTQSGDVTKRQPEQARDPAAPPRNTTSDTWRDLHPARVWPD